jgi:hypothetical protein
LAQDLKVVTDMQYEMRRMFEESKKYPIAIDYEKACRLLLEDFKSSNPKINAKILEKHWLNEML